MKKRTLKLIACAAVMTLVLSVTACGGSDDAGKTEDKAPVEDVEDAGQDTEAGAESEAGTETGTEAEADTAALDGAESYASLEEYYNDPSVKSVLDAAFESMGGEGMSLSIEVKENVLTMICQFEDSSVTAESAGDALNAGLDANAATFASQAATFDQVVGETGACTVVVRYADSEGNVLVEKEFKAQ